MQLDGDGQPLASLTLKVNGRDHARSPRQKAKTRSQKEAPRHAVIISAAIIVGVRSAHWQIKTRMSFAAMIASFDSGDFLTFGFRCFADGRNGLVTQPDGRTSSGFWCGGCSLRTGQAELCAPFIDSWIIFANMSQMPMFASTQSTGPVDILHLKQ